MQLKILDKVLSLIRVVAVALLMKFTKKSQAELEGNCEKSSNEPSKSKMPENGTGL